MRGIVVTYIHSAKIAVQYIIAGLVCHMAPGGTSSGIAPQTGAGLLHLVQHRIVGRLLFGAGLAAPLSFRPSGRDWRCPLSRRARLSAWFKRSRIDQRQCRLATGHREIDACQQFGIDECAMDVPLGCIDLVTFA